MDIKFDRSNGVIDSLIDELIDQVVVHHPYIIREMILSALKAGQTSDYLADLKLIRTTMKEMRYTNKVFSPYRSRRKVTIFGSARTEAHEPIYQKCERFSRLLAEHNYMVITGGGGGIMQAGNEGAGEKNSFAVNIQLPFEQDTNVIMEDSDRVLLYKYFFNRKVAFLKETDAIALFPGGFGTMDEAMEALTLLQTGKTPPIPLVLIDDDEGTYWEDWFQFFRDVLLPKGLISGEDFGLFTITRSAEEAVEVIHNFYNVYHSSRYVGNLLVLRLNKALTSEQIQVLESEFPEILVPNTKITAVTAFDKERDEPDLWDLPRLAIKFNRRSYGLLNSFIRRINSF
ncbi:MAG: TIGR00730 family Rossman fold protein [Desulfuromonas sp.]|nr:TIGR00730 family Rossman fold protein [Desulfuromonas sp.]